MKFIVVLGLNLWKSNTLFTSSKLCIEIHP